MAVASLQITKKNETERNEKRKPPQMLYYTTVYLINIIDVVREW